MSLRIVAGTHKRRLIDEVPGETTRPTTDRNREALFNILGQYFEGGHALDLCAGTGALGIECLSRGMERVTFVDNGPLALKTLKGNLATLALTKQGQVVASDAIRFLEQTKETYDLVLCDPPYRAGLYDAILKMVGERDLLTAEGILVLEADKSQTFESTAGLLLYDQRVMGNTRFAFFQRRTSS